MAIIVNDTTNRLSPNEPVTRYVFFFRLNVCRACMYVDRRVEPRVKLICPNKEIENLLLYLSFGRET